MTPAKRGRIGGGQLSNVVYAVAAAVYKLYPFYIIMYDIGISFTFTRKRVHPVSPSDNPGRLKVAHRMPFSMRGQADDRVLAAQIQLASIAKVVSGKDVCIGGENRSRFHRDHPW